MDILEISIASDKYIHNIKRAFIVISSDIETLALLDIDFVECKIEVMVNLEMVDGSLEVVKGHLNDDGNLIEIVGEFQDVYPVYHNTFTDSTLCEFQDKIGLRKY